MDQFDKVIELNSQPICIKICREDKCNLNRPKSQCKSVEYYQRRNRLHEKNEGQRNQKNDQNERNQRNKRDIFLEYSSHDPITDLLKAVSKKTSERFQSFDISNFLFLANHQLGQLGHFWPTRSLYAFSLENVLFDELDRSLRPTIPDRSGRSFPFPQPRLAN